MKDLVPYADALSQQVGERISSVLTAKSAGREARQVFRYHANSDRSMRFQSYYFTTVNDREAFRVATDFFKAFKARYALQGVDSRYLGRLEAEKARILERIDRGDLAGVYRDYFARARIRQSNGVVTKNLGSFFTKLVHTFRPADYCALDNPVKEYFGLRSEGFFVAFTVTSAAYRNWATKHTSEMAEIRQAFLSTPALGTLGPGVTDLKLLDLIFWRKANA